MSPFILAIILDFWRMSTSRDTGSGTINKFDPENMGIAVGILLLCALEFEICLGVKYPHLLANVAKKLLPGQGCYNMPVFKLSAAKRMCMLTGYILSKMHQFSAAIEI